MRSIIYSEDPLFRVSESARKCRGREFWQRLSQRAEQCVLTALMLVHKFGELSRAPTCHAMHGVCDWVDVSGDGLAWRRHAQASFGSCMQHALAGETETCRLISVLLLCALNPYR